ncbi:MAG TPA: hypothetical protein VJ001_07020 [Rhodocyclaceae bacterium]|nr:hypothetical protein [Rhodocyclaceae bacterium]
MELLRDRDYFKLYLDGDVLIVQVSNTENTPVFDHQALEQMLETIRDLVEEQRLTQRQWYAIYDFSELIQFKSTAIIPLANFFRWARAHGRRKTAFIMPVLAKRSELSLMARVFFSLVEQFTLGREDHHSAQTIADARRWIDLTRRLAPTATRNS